MKEQKVVYFFLYFDYFNNNLTNITKIEGEKENLISNECIANKNWMSYKLENLENQTFQFKIYSEWGGYFSFIDNTKEMNISLNDFID